MLTNVHILIPGMAEFFVGRRPDLITARADRVQTQSNVKVRSRKSWSNSEATWFDAKEHHYGKK